MLDGLSAWEQKMDLVGVIDHLGLASALHRYAEAVCPVFSYAVVDEAQDFGTLELRLIRRLVAEGPNDLFLCGDPSQRVYAKHRSPAEAGIDLPAARSHSITRNYRNTREILALADVVLVRALKACGDAGGGDPELTRIEPELA
jgi:superfamily I DNA/RNA helicase